LNLRRAIILVFGLWALCVSAVTAQIEGETLTVRLSDDGISTLDPIFAGDLTTQQALHSMYVGLTRFDPITNALQPGLAQRWSTTTLPDGRVLYRFFLRQDIPWVKYDTEFNEVMQVENDNGNPITVSRDDVVYGILRALDPEYANEYSYQLAEAIENGVAYLDGEVPVEDLGIVVNLNDIGIVASSPEMNIPHLMSQIPMLPQPSWLIDELGLDWATAENFVSYGPYALESWVDSELSMITNPYWDPTDAVPQADIDNLRFVFLDDEDAFLAYEAGEIDVIVNMSPDLIPSLREQYPEQFSQHARQSVQFFAMNLRESYPTEFPELRQALAHAIDRDQLAEVIRDAGYVPADRLMPPGTVNAPTTTTALTLPYDGDTAREDLMSLGAENTEIDVIYLNTGYFSTVATAVAEMWEAELGIEVNLFPQDVQGSFTNRQYGAVWIGDLYSDTLTGRSYLVPFAAENDFRTASELSSEAFDSAYNMLLANSADDTETDVTDLLATMERALIEEVLIIPVSWSADNELIKPNITRTPTDNGLRSFETWQVSS